MMFSLITIMELMTLSVCRTFLKTTTSLSRTTVTVTVSWIKISQDVTLLEIFSVDTHQVELLRKMKIQIHTFIYISLLYKQQYIHKYIKIYFMHRTIL